MKLDALNPEQREAVRIPGGPILVLAGAGTGKTRVITYRIARLLADGVPAGQILAVTFTNKAAREMAERVEHLVGAELARQVTLSTFHSFCARLLRRYASRLGIGAGFGIATQAYQVGLVKGILGELGLAALDGGAQAALSVISRAKTALRTPADLRADDAPPHEQVLADVYELYQRRLRNMDLLDFDDLLVEVLRLWEREPSLLAQHRQQYRHILVDEYQDTNTVQFRIVAALAGRDGNLCVVGDDDQSIYGWRGADISNILQFAEHFPGAHVIRLERNYRSTSAILAAANHVIANNRARHAKRLWTEQAGGDKLLVVHVEREEEEARFVVDWLREKQALEHRRPRDVAVLYRSNHQSKVLEDGLREARIPYNLVGSRSFYERKEIMDAISLLGVVANPKDDMSLLRVLNVPPRGMGDRAVERLREWMTIVGRPLYDLLQSTDVLAELPAETAEGARRFRASLERHRQPLMETGGLAAKVQAFLQDIGYLDGLARMYKPREDALRRRENVEELVNSAARLEAARGPAPNLIDFLQTLHLQDDNDRVERDRRQAEDAVTLMTVHAAKGLEFPLVVVTGLEQNLFPHHQAMAEGALEEERRLFYVAVTRAREQLVLTYALQRRVQGKVMPRRPSVFLAELPDEWTERVSRQEAFKPASPEVAAEYLAQMRAMFAPPGAGGRK